MPYSVLASRGSQFRNLNFALHRNRNLIGVRVVNRGSESEGREGAFISISEESGSG